MKNGTPIICLIMTILALLMAGFHGYIKEQQRKELLRQDSVRYELYNNQILKIDSMVNNLKKQDSLQDIRIQYFKKKVNVDKKRYEENSNIMPFLPDFK